MAIAEQFFQFFGRLHPMLLHAPIGLLIGLVSIELLSVMRKRPLAAEVRCWMAWLVTAAAAASIATGLVLRREGGYGTDTVDLHQWLGISLGSGCLIAAVLQQFGKVIAYRVMLFAAAVISIPAGHLGASLTHGEGFLTHSFRAPVIGPAADVTVDGALVHATSEYASTIAPILENRCVGCHGAAKSKGGLRLDSPEGIAKGGESVIALTAFSIDESEIVVRMKLPLDHDDHMPPKAKPQPEAAEIAAISDWIVRGASFTASANSAIASTGAAAKPPVEAAVRAADAGAIDAIRDSLIHVAPVSQGSVLLVVDCAAVANTFDDAECARLLEPIAANIVELSVARSKITNESMRTIAKMNRLKRLDVGFTAISDAGLQLLGKDQAIEELVIARTMVSDIAAIEKMPALKRLYCWGTKLSTEQIAQLKEGHKGLFVDAGEQASAAALEVEQPPVLAAAAVKPVAAASAPPDLKPVNTICPVSGKPISLSKLVVYKGQVVGMCCEHCAEEFLADPEKFAAKIVK